MAVMLCGSATGAVPERPWNGSSWVEALGDDARGDEAVCRLLARGDEVEGAIRYREDVPDDGCRVVRVADNRSQPGGVVAVFLAHAYSDETLQDGSAGGHFVLFDPDGRRVAAFEKYNSLGDTDGLIRYRGQALAIVSRVSYGGLPSGWDASGLFVVPLDTAQQPILALILGVRKTSERVPAHLQWQWRARDLDADGAVEIEIGSGGSAGFIPKALYRYSVSTGRYEGPAGSPDGDFLLVTRRPQGDSWWKVADNFARGHDDAGSCDACASARSPEATAWEQLDRSYHSFKAAHAAADTAGADQAVLAFGEAATRTTRMRLDRAEEIASYWIFERARCNLDFLPDKRRAELLKWHRVFPEAILVCEASKLRLESEDALRRQATRLLDERARPYGGQRTDVYDAFARQRTINRRALEFLARLRLDDQRFERDGDSALIEQIRAGRTDNVRLLLDTGYDPNVGVPRLWRKSSHEAARAPHYPQPVLPLQAVRESLATQGERALDIAQLLLDRGANPNRLRWYPAYRKVEPAPGDLESRLRTLLQDSAARQPSVSAEFRGYRVEMDDEGSTTTYARFVIGNGSESPAAIRAWTDAGDYLLGGLHYESHLETQLTGGSEWHDGGLVIEHGWSPATELVLQPGESGEVLFRMSPDALLAAPEGTRYRLRIATFPGAILSEPFLARDRRYAVTYASRTAPRDWYGDKKAGAGSAPASGRD